MKLKPMSFTGYKPEKKSDEELQKLLELQTQRMRESYNKNNLSRYVDIETDLCLTKMEIKYRRDEKIAFVLYQFGFLAHAILP